MSQQAQSPFWGEGEDWWYLGKGMFRIKMKAVPWYKMSDGTMIYELFVTWRDMAGILARLLSDENDILPPDQVVDNMYDMIYGFFAAKRPDGTVEMYPTMNQRLSRYYYAKIRLWWSDMMMKWPILGEYCEGGTCMHVILWPDWYDCDDINMTSFEMSSWAFVQNMGAVVGGYVETPFGNGYHAWTVMAWPVSIELDEKNKEATVIVEFITLDWAIGPEFCPVRGRKYQCGKITYTLMWVLRA